jgi:hypothetical protein
VTPLDPHLEIDMAFERMRDEPLDAVVNVRVTSAEKAELREAASLAGLSVSEYVRRRALGRRVVASADLAVIRELRRLGGLVKHIYAQSGDTYSRETAAALAAVKMYIEQLGASTEQKR